MDHFGVEGNLCETYVYYYISKLADLQPHEGCCEHDTKVGRQPLVLFDSWVGSPQDDRRGWSSCEARC